MSNVPIERWYTEPELTWMDLLGDGVDLADMMAPERPFSDRRISDTPPELIEEFRSSPLGPYSPALQEVLCVMRTQDRGGRYILLRQRGRTAWVVARVHERGRAPERVLEAEFADRGEAEWAVFALRWREHTGRSLEPMGWQK